jgi:leucine dehydrogenase
MRELIESWGGETVVVRFDAPSGTWCFIALHDSTLGMPVGGCRIRIYAAPEDGLRDAMLLAEGMTYKWAALDFPFGGGKAVLAVPGPLEGAEREGLLLRFARLVDSLGGAFATGVDLGTTPQDMQLMARECRYVMGQSGAGDGSESLDPGPYTALGVFAGTVVAARHGLGKDDLRGTAVLVQGAGDVGAPLARLLSEAGAEVIVADVDDGRARSLADEVGGAVVAANEVYETECDVFAPCAVGAILNPETIPRLRCRIVAGSANNQLAARDDAVRLHDRGILWAPDYIINAGGALAFGLIHQLVRSESILRERVRQIGDTLDHILASAVAAGESPLLAAQRRAEAILSKGRTSEP